MFLPAYNSAKIIKNPSRFSIVMIRNVLPPFLWFTVYKGAVQCQMPTRGLLTVTTYCIMTCCMLTIFVIEIMTVDGNWFKMGFIAYYCKSKWQ